MRATDPNISSFVRSPEDQDVDRPVLVHRIIPILRGIPEDSTPASG
jgi:hypothetical protein